MHYVGIGFLHQGLHPLYCFLSLSNPQERRASKLDRMFKARSAILRRRVPLWDR
jgi:hypothetical protein